MIPITNNETGKKIYKLLVYVITTIGNGNCKNKMNVQKKLQWKYHLVPIIYLLGNVGKDRRIFTTLNIQKKKTLN